MKKYIGLFLIITLAFSGLALAVMDDQPFVSTVAGVQTNAQNQVLRGELYAIHFDVAASSTQTITVATARQLIFKKDVTADGIYYPMVPLCATNGNAITFVGGTNDTANAFYGKIPLAGKVTVTVLGGNAVTSTNANTTTLIYNK